MLCCKRSFSAIIKALPLLTVSGRRRRGGRGRGKRAARITSGQGPVGVVPVAEGALPAPCDQQPGLATATTTTTATTATTTSTLRPPSCPVSGSPSLTGPPIQRSGRKNSSRDSKESINSSKILGTSRSGASLRQLPEVRSDSVVISGSAIAGPLSATSDSQSACLPSIDEPADNRPLVQSIDSNNPRSSPSALTSDMKGLGPSFGSQARAAELNAATAAKARNAGEDSQPVHTSFSSQQSLAYNAPVPPGFSDAVADSGAWKPLSAVPPKYTQGTMDHRPPPSRAPVRTTTRAVSSSTSTPRAAHPLRNVTTLDAGRRDHPRDTLRASQTTANPSSTSQNTPGVMGPDDISPTKQEEKQTARGIELHSSRGNALGGGDPFVSTISDYSVDLHGLPYQISGPPTHEYPQSRRPTNVDPGQIPSYHNSVPPGFYNNRVAGSDGRGQGSTPHPFSMSTKDVDAQSSAEREALVFGWDGRGQQRAESTPTNSSVNAQYSTPTRSAQTGNSDRLRPGGSMQDGIKPEHTGSSVEFATSHNSTVVSHDSRSATATRRHAEHGESSAAYAAPITDMQYAQPSLENPLLQPRFQNSVPPAHFYDTNLLQSYAEPFEDPQHTEPDAFPHLRYHERPVPWIVTPHEAYNATRQSTRNPPPGLPLPDPEQDNIVQPSDDPSEIMPDPAVPERPPSPPADQEGQEHLRQQIATIGHDYKTRCQQAGSSDAAARRSEEMTLLLGSLLVNLQSYVVGDPSRQTANFADFREVPEHAVGPSRSGRRTYLDIDPRVDPWMLPLWRENAHNRLTN